MNRHKALFLLLLLAAFSLSSCSGLPKAGGGGGGGTGTATLSFTLVADTLPAHPSIISFKVSVLSITLTPTSGTAQTFTPPSPIIIDLMRLQSDTAFLGSLANVPSGTYTAQVSLSSSSITFFNDTGANLTAGSLVCPNNAVCSTPLSAIGNPTIAAFTFTASTGGKQGIGFDFNLKNAITISAGTLTVNLNPTAPNPGVLTAFTLPRTNANLGSNQLELLEDFTGVVSLNGSNVTITSPVRGALTATETSNSFFDASPDGTICPTPATFGCVVNGQIASVDAFLNNDGTISLKEFEPLTSTQQDRVEGIVMGVFSANQFSILVTDETQAATGSLIGGLSTGNFLTVNIPSPKPFFVDTKGLAVPPGSSGLFAGATDTTVMRPGQAVSLHVTSFTPATNTTVASATADTVTLRWSRLVAGIVSATTTQVTVNAIPSYIGSIFAAGLQTEVFTGTLGAKGVTNLDGVTDAGSLSSNLPVGLRVLFLENSTNTAQFPFSAAKIRQH